jgi:hypothetical protein
MTRSVEMTSVWYIRIWSLNHSEVTVMRRLALIR